MNEIKSLINDSNLTNGQIDSIKILTNKIDHCKPLEILSLEIKGKIMNNPSLKRIVSLSLKNMNGSIPVLEIEGYQNKIEKDFFYNDDNIFVLPTGKMILESKYKENFDKETQFVTNIIKRYFIN